MVDSAMTDSELFRSILAVECILDDLEGFPMADLGLATARWQELVAVAAKRGLSEIVTA
jgi:hypothetical protein